MGRVSKYLQNPLLIYPFATSIGLTRWVSDELHLKLMYRALIGKGLDLTNPKTFNAKLQWLKLHDRNPNYIKLVDKYAVKGWVAEKLGADYVAETYASWGSAEDIDISALPERFVLKTNHDCGGVVVCNNRQVFDIDAARRKLNRHLRTNYYWGGREWPYRDVKPLVFAEQFLGEETNGEKPVEMVDYKFMCFAGSVRCAFTCTGRARGDLRVDFFDNDWNHLPFERHYANADVTPNAPVNLEFMLKAAETLASGIPFVRVDFYEIGDRPYFGEMTLYPGSGFEEFTPDYWDKMLGDWLALPIKGLRHDNGSAHDEGKRP